MAQNSIGQVIDNMRLNKQATGTATTTTNFSYTPTQESVKKTNNGLTDALGGLIEFAKNATVAVDAYGKSMKKQGDERSEEIIRTMTPEQRSQALGNGTLLYQDDPYTMAALHQKVAQSAILLSDNQIQNNIANGVYKDQKSLNDDIVSQRMASAAQVAEMNGFDINNEDFQKGLNYQANQRTVSLQESFLRKQSENTRTNANFQNTVEINSAIKNSLNLPAAQVADQIVGLVNNSTLSDQDKMAQIGNAMQAASTSPQGAGILTELRSRQFNVFCKNVTPVDIFGESGMQKYQQVGDESTYSMDRKSREEFDNEIQRINSMSDPSQRLSAIAGLHEKLNKTQFGQMETPERKQLFSLQQQTQEMQRQINNQNAQLQAKQSQADGRADVIYNQMQQATFGNTDAVIDMNGQATNQALGKFTTEDTINAANRYYRNVMSDTNLTPEQKSEKILYMAARTPKGQGLNILLQGKVNQAQIQFNAAGINGQLDFSKTPELNELMQIYKTNPAALATVLGNNKDGMALYGNIAMLVGASDAGIDPTIIAQGVQKMNSMDDTERQLVQTKTSDFDKTTVASSQFSGLSGLPSDMARNIFRLTYITTRNETLSQQLARSYLERNTIRVDNDGVNGSLMKSSLQVTEDPRSVEFGKDIIDSKLNEITTKYPYLKGNLAIQTSSDGNILITSPSGLLGSNNIGASRIIISRDDLIKEYQANNKSKSASNSNTPMTRDEAITQQEQKMLNQKKINKRDEETRKEKAKTVTGLDDLYGRTSTK
ncbi:TPA: hypothetical protein ACG1UU_003006 [Kluyvera ascorbata]